MAGRAGTAGTPRTPGTSDLEVLENLMDRAWPAPVRNDTGEWVFRAAEGVTQRANSVWPRCQARSAPDALREAEQWYRLHRLPPIFQVFDDEKSSALNALLDERRYTRQSETLIMVRGTAPALTASSARDVDAIAGVELAAAPSAEWLGLWWSVDGRGGASPPAIVRTILVGCPALYALVRDDDGTVAAVGRLALPEGSGWGGVYAMATSPQHRRNGYASAVLEALLTVGRKLDVEGFWLLVTKSNAGARMLYGKAGFTERGRYLYRQAPLRRAPGGC